MQGSSKIISNCVNLYHRPFCLQLFCPAFDPLPIKGVVYVLRDAWQLDFHLACFFFASMSCQVHWEQSHLRSFPNLQNFAVWSRTFYTKSGQRYINNKLFRERESPFSRIFANNKEDRFLFFLWGLMSQQFDIRRSAVRRCTQPDCPRAHCVALVVISRNGMLPLAPARHSVTSL